MDWNKEVLEAERKKKQAANALKLRQMFTLIDESGDAARRLTLGPDNEENFLIYRSIDKSRYMLLSKS